MHTTIVTTPVASHDLTTLDAVKLRLGITDTAQDALLSDYITRASAMIESYLGRPIGVQTLLETWRIPILPRRDFYVLAFTPVGVITTITEDAVELVVDTDYTFEPATGIVYRLSGDSGVRRRWGYHVIIDYTAGYDTVPVDVEAICIDLIVTAHVQANRDPSVQLELTEGVGRTAYFNRGWATFAFDDSMKLALAPYMAIYP